MNSLRKTWLDIQSQRRRSMMASNKLVKGYLSVNNSCFEIILFIIKNHPIEPTITIEPRDKTQHNTYFSMSDSNVDGISQYENECKIVVNRGNFPALNLSFASNLAYTKVLDMLKIMMSESSGEEEGH